MFNDNNDLSDSPPCTEAERTELRNEASNASLINPNLASTLQNVTFILSETLTTTILSVLDLKCIWDLLLYIKRIIAKKKHFEAGGIAHILGSLTTMNDAQS